MPISDHIFPQNLDNHLPIATVIDSIECSEVLVTSHGSFADVFQHSHLIQKLVIGLVVFLWNFLVLFEISRKSEFVSVLVALFMDDLLLDWLNLCSLLLFLHWVVLEHSKTTFFLTVKCWWALLCVELFHVLHCDLFAHLLFFVVYKWVLVIARVEPQCQHLMWGWIGFVVFGRSTFFYRKRLSFKCTFSFCLKLFQTFFLILTSSAHNASCPLLIQILWTRILFNRILVLYINLKNCCLFLQAVKVNIVHV